MSNDLLGPSDPDPVRLSGDPLAPRPFLITGDHAGRAIPASLGDLGLAAAERARHIAVDIGVEELGLVLGERLGAPFLRQAYSRLVIDCNRDPARADSIPEVSDGTRIPGNMALGQAGRAARVAALFDPYHRALGDLLDVREAAGLETVFVALHSFTPVMGGLPRDCEIGVLYLEGRTGFAHALSARLRRPARFAVADNEPYTMDDIDYSVPHHAVGRGLRYAELEIRQDLVDPRSDADIAAMARFLAEALEDTHADPAGR